MNTADERYELRQALHRVVEALVQALIPPAAPPTPAPAAPSPTGKYMTSREILARMHISKTTLYRWIDEGRFPRPTVQLGHQQPRWLTAEILAWEAAATPPP